MKNKEMGDKKKSSLPVLLVILIILVAIFTLLIVAAFGGGEESFETVEVSAVITEETKKAETSETTTKKITTTAVTTQTTETKTTVETITQTTTSTTTATEIATTTTTVPSDSAITQLYLDFFEPYVKSFDKLTLDDFRNSSNEKLSSYDVKITEGNENDLWSFTISDSNGNSIYMAFYATGSTYETPSEEWIWTLTTLSYNSNGNEISVSDRFHINAKPTYIIYDKNAETPSKEVANIDELKEFMFK